MYTVEYSENNIYTGNVSETSDIKYVKVFDSGCDFIAEKSVISYDVSSTASFCFYKNKGTNIFPFGNYKKDIINFSNKTFYQDTDIDHGLVTVSGYKSSSSFLGASDISFSFGGNCGIKVSFDDVYNTVLSIWVYINNDTLYVENNDSILYSADFQSTSFTLSLYNDNLIINSTSITTLSGCTLPYSLFAYGDFNDINILPKTILPMALSGDGDIIGDIYGDVYCITEQNGEFGYLKSKANNILTSCSGFAFDIAFRAIGSSIPFSISNGATFSGGHFDLVDPCVWVEIDTYNSVFNSNLVTSSGLVTISGIASSLNDYYLMRCYYDGNTFGTILNGTDVSISSSAVTISGGHLNILTNKTLIIDSFALYDDVIPSQENYDRSLGKLNIAVSGTALVNSNDENKLTFAVDNFYPDTYNYATGFKQTGDVSVFASPSTYYTNYFLAAGETVLNYGNFYVTKYPFNESVYNCFVKENDKTFLTYFSGIVVPANEIIAESFTNYGYSDDDFITTNSGLYIRNCSRVFDKIDPVSVVKFSNIGWRYFLNVGVLFGVDSIPEFPNEAAASAIGNNVLNIGTTSFSGLNITDNSSIYFYIDDSYITVSGSDTGVLASGTVTQTYDYMRYFISSSDFNWDYARLITLDEATTVQDYQVKLDLPLGFDYSGIKENGDDLRFYTIDEVELGYWIEHWDTGGISTIWVKVTASGTSEFYMTYGDSSATPASDGDNVFEFFDDFDGTSLDTDKWTLPDPAKCTYQVADSNIDIFPTVSFDNTFITLKEPNKVELPAVVSAKVKSSDGSCGGLSVRAYNGASNKIYFMSRDVTCESSPCSDGPFIRERVYSATTDEQIFYMPTTTNDVWFNLTSKIRNDNKVEGYVDGTLKGTSSIEIDSDGYCRVWFGTDCCQSGKHQYMDRIFIRKYTSSEPTASVGDELWYLNFASISDVSILTKQKNVNTLTNKYFDYFLPESYNLDNNYKELFYNTGNNILGNAIILYDYDFYDLECSFSSYYDTAVSGMFNTSGYSFLGINDDFSNGFIAERWRLVCEPYGVYSCNQPGLIQIDYASCGTYCQAVKMYDGDIVNSINTDPGYVVSSGVYYYTYFSESGCLVDTITAHFTSNYIQPEDGFVISCDIKYYSDGNWYYLIDDYASPTLSGISWPIRHDIQVPLTRCDAIHMVANTDWDKVVLTELRPACHYNYGGTSVCTTSGITCMHVALDDVLHVYSEYSLEGQFNLSVSGINYYPLNSKIHLKSYLEKECYIKTDWVDETTCSLVVSTAASSISTTVSGLSGEVTYLFELARSLDVVTLSGSTISGSVYNSYPLSSEDLELRLGFYNKNIPNAAGSGCLFGFESDDFSVNFSSISAGYVFESIDGTTRITKAGVGFNTYPPNLFVEHTENNNTTQSHSTSDVLTASGLDIAAKLVDRNVSVSVCDKTVGGIQQISKFNRVGLFSDYMFVPTIFYKVYIIGDGKQYSSFSDISGLVKTGDKVYFYPGNYTVNTNKQLTIIGIGNIHDIKLNITNASSGITIIGCTTAGCSGAGVFNLYNCYVLPWNYTGNIFILYDVVNINFYNCELYNYSYMSYAYSYALLNKCTVYRTVFYRVNNTYITIYDEGYSEYGHYGYGPTFNRASVISGLSHVDSILVSSFYYDSRYNCFPLSTQTAIGNDSCNQLINDSDKYSVYFYGDLKKLDSFHMYLFIQNLDGKIEIKNSSDFLFTVDSNNLSVGMRLVMDICGASVDMSVPVSHSNVFKLCIICVEFDGGAISIYLNGAKLATKYVIIVDFSDQLTYLNDSIVFFDDTKFVCDDGLLLKGGSLRENVDFLIGTHVEEIDSGCSTTIKVNMELSTDPILSDYHGNSTFHYGYVANNTGVGTYFDETAYNYKSVYFKGEKSYKIYKNITQTYIGPYTFFSQGSCSNKSTSTYIAPKNYDSVLFGPATIDDKLFGACNIIDPYGYAALYLSLPLPAIQRTSHCFDATLSVILFSFDITYPYVHDVGPSQLPVSALNLTYGLSTVKNGIFHNSVEYQGGYCCYVEHNNILNLNNNFTIEALVSFYSDNGYSGSLVTKGTNQYNVAYRVGIDSRHLPYFTWSWEGDNTLYADRQIQVDSITYLVVVVGTDTVSFYINGEPAGIRHTNKLTIINNSERLYCGYGYYRGYNRKKQLTIEEVCISNNVKTEESVKTTWDKVSGGEYAPWIKITSVAVVSDKPIKVSPSDRFIEEDSVIDTSKWEYVSYTKPQAVDGLILNSKVDKKVISKVVSYNVVFDVSIFCEFLEYSENRDWSITFKYKFASGNYLSVIVNYVKYDNLYVKCEYYYNGYKDNTSTTGLPVSPCGIRFVTNKDGNTSAQIGNNVFWYTLWTSSENLFVDTSGWLEIILSNDDWDSWFYVKLTKFLSKLYCSDISNGQTEEIYTAIPYGRAFYNLIPENVATLTLNNDIFEIDSNNAGSNCTHSLEFINGQMTNLHVLTTNNHIFNNINYEIFNIELLVYVTYSDTKILDLFPWITIEVKNKYLYITMIDNDRTITDSISVLFNNYMYIAVSISNPHTTIHINDQEFTYDTNFTDVLPYYFYPIGKSFTGRVVYFCGYHGSFDEEGYAFRVNTLNRYIGFDCCGRKIYGNNMVTGLDPDSIIYNYNNPAYSSIVADKSCDISLNESSDVKILFDSSVLQYMLSSSVIVRCDYQGLSGEKKTSINISGKRYNVNHNYYDSFGHIGENTLVFDYTVVGTCYENAYSIFYLDMDISLVEEILKGTVVFNVENNETKHITNIYMYLTGSLCVNDTCNLSLIT